MVTKTFKADSMLQTLQLVQAELGADAIVVSMREVPLGPSWNPWNKTTVEIVAASSDSQLALQAAAAPAPILRPSENKTGVEFVEEIPQIEWVTKPEKPVVEKLTPPSTAVNADPKPAAPKPVAKPQADDKYLPPSLKKIQQQLISQDVDNTLIEGLLNVALETLSPGTLSDNDASKKSITQLLGAELRIQQGAGTYVSSNVICLIGASGSGKTSTVAKLALFFSQKLQKTVTWVCADTIRIGAIAESRAFTDALGIKLKLVYTPEDLKEIFQNREESDLFLVDTPGYNPCNESQITELGALLAELPKRCTYLVAPATTKETDLYQLSAALGIFNLDGLIITKLDETHTFGSVYNFARKNQLPLSFFTTGKEAARNLEVSDPARLVAALFGKEWNK
ncbi:MAG: hypothetical protein NT121_03915 [Chloroflexi bacterium]|nr:hypothetical protein [Chloroflexota bacterium]